MFLAMTADQRFWKKDTPLVFLGEWCKLYSQRVAWENIPHEVLPYHWDDREKFYRDYAYLQNLYERVLSDLSLSLNTIHQENHSARYWRIIIGAWLFYFIQVFFDRHACIDQALKSGKPAAARVGRYGPAAYCPQDYTEFAGSSVGDDYNQFLYSWLIERMPGLKIEYTDFPAERFPGNEKPVKKNGRGWGKKILKKAVSFYDRHLPYRFNRTVLVSSYLNRADLFRLQLSLGQWPSFCSPKVKIGDYAFCPQMRDRLSLSDLNNPFEILLSDIIKQQIPFIYMEGYQEAKIKALARYSKNPDVILTATDFHSNDAFKLWAAHWAEQGTKLLGIQHGGVYGLTGFCAAEEHEVNCSDTFYSWGWRSDKLKNVKPLAAAKLNSVRFTKSKPDGKILLALMTLPRYSYHLYTIPIGATGMLAYFQDQFRFVESLVPAVQKALLVRFHPTDYDLSQKKRWQDRFPGLEYDCGEMSMHQRLRESRLFVGTYNATGYLETFAANFPTILYWDPRYWELRESARPYFAALKRVGILHDTPESAAQKINEIFADPLGWWHQPEIQQVRDEFCRRFAGVSETWLQEWKTELLRQGQRTSREGKEN